MRAALSRLLLIVFSTPLLAYSETNPTWTTPVAPFRIADNLYYVGSQELASYLVVTPQGNILINANLATSPPQIRASVEKLGFRWTDIKILLNSQAHFDHMAGAAEVIRETHAKNMVMDGDVSVVESGGATDFAYGPKPQYPPSHVDRILHDGEKVSLGGAVLTAHKTPGHTRGCVTMSCGCGEGSPAAACPLCAAAETKESHHSPTPSDRLLLRLNTGTDTPAARKLALGRWMNPSCRTLILLGRASPGR